MEWSTHCNTLEHRAGRCGTAAWRWPDRHPPRWSTGSRRAHCEDMRRQVSGLLEATRTWVDIERVPWGQRYIVATLCGMLYSMATDAVASKPASMLWATRELAPEWRPLIEAALIGRAIGWDPDDHPSAEAVAQTERFAAYAARVAADLWTSR